MVYHVLQHEPPSTTQPGIQKNVRINTHTITTGMASHSHSPGFDKNLMSSYLSIPAIIIQSALFHVDR